MTIDTDLAACLGLDPTAVDLSAFLNIMLGFTSFIPKLVTVNGLLEVLPLNPADLPQLIVGDFAAQIPAPLGTLKIPQPEGLEVPVFDPGALVDFVTGLGDIALGLPGLFGLSLEIGDLTTSPPPIPQIPDLNALIGLVSVSIGLTAPNVPIDFPGNFAECFAKIVAGFIGIPV